MRAVWVFFGCLNAAMLTVHALAGSGFWTIAACTAGLVAAGWLYDQECEP